MTIQDDFLAALESANPRKELSPIWDRIRGLLALFGTPEWAEFIRWVEASVDLERLMSTDCVDRERGRVDAFREVLGFETWINVVNNKLTDAVREI